MFENLESRRLLATTYAYTLTDLTPNEIGTSANGISNNGKIALSIGGHPAIWDKGVITKLNFAGSATDVNDAGQIVGIDTSGPASATNLRGFIYSNGVETKIGLPGYTTSQANAINANGDVVGYSEANGFNHAILYKVGKTTDLGTLPGGSYSNALGVNDSDQIVGYASTSTGGTHGFVYQNGKIQDLGTLPGGTGSRAIHGINNAGLIAGDSNTGGTGYRAYTSKNGGALTLVGGVTGASDTYVTDINASGEFVGTTAFAAPKAPGLNAFAYVGGKFINLNDQIDPKLGWTLAYATGVNDSGAIVGYGFIGNSTHAFLLTPTAAPAQPATISGTVYTDINSNGKRDNGEPTISKVVVTLTSGNVSSTTKTDANGVYAFANVDTSRDPYTLTVTLPRSSGPSASVSPTSGQTLSGQDFGIAYDPTLSDVIYGTVYDDANGNGKQDDGEAGVGNVTITEQFTDIYNSGIGNKTFTTKTDATGLYPGLYYFTKLPAGQNAVFQTLPAGYKETTANSGKTFITDSGNIPVLIDFGRQKSAAPTTGTVSGIAFKDLNANGKQDSGETGLGGVEIDAGDGFAITKADGTYSITRDPGTYFVFTSTPSGYSVTTNPEAELTVTAGKSTTFNVGEIPSSADPGKSTIKGTVFNDANSNGVQDNGEAGIKGVTVSATQTVQPALVAAAAPAPTLVTTDASGNYIFTNLAAGDYTVADTVPAADTQTAPASGKYDLTIGLSGSQTIFGQNFGLKAKPVAATHSVSGTVYNDTNNDSKLTAGEAGFGGITVTLTPTGNTPGKVQTFVTTSNGLYSFSGLADGSYTVSAPVPTGYTKTSPSEGNAFFLTFVQGNGDTVGANFGFYKAPVANDSISGTVFTDANNNHVLDAGETGIAGVTVTLTPQNGAAPTTFVTTSSGVYSFTGLAVGQYGVKSTVPSGFTQTAPNVKPTFLIDLTTSGQSVSQANFGFYKAPAQLISITGLAFNDANGNGLRDQGEFEVLPGVTIKLTGLATATTTTGNGGGFTFSNLAPGIYTLTQVALNGYTTTTQPLTLDAPHYDALPLFGQKKADVATGIVTGHVYVDANGNGKADPGEAPVANATIVLIPGNGIPASRPASPPAGSIVVTSNAAGDYEAVGLKPGPYAEYQQLPAGFTQTQPKTTFYGIGVVSGQTIIEDFGRQAIAPANNASVAGTVFNDANNNGKQDSGESGLANVEVDLTLGNTVTVVKTAANGSFAFKQLAAGTYTVTEKVLTGYTQTTPASGGYTVTLASGQAVSGELFGQFQTPIVPTTGNVSGTAFNDVNGDGIRQNGDGALAGVTIHLVPVQANLAASPALVAGLTTVTGADGSYSFSNVAPGTYNLYEDVLIGYTQTVPSQDAYGIDVVAGGSVTGKTFAQHNTVTPPPPGTGTITGTLWNDSDGDGMFNNGEVATGARTVFLDTNGNGKLDAGERSTMSNAAGVYTFNKVATGTVKVSRVFPAGFHLSNAAAGTNGHDVLAIVTGGGTATADLGTFGNDGTPPPPPPQTGSISGTLWNDTDGDGLFNNGEGSTGVRTVFLDANGNGKLDANERSTTSNGAGVYTFGNVAIGSVKVSRLFPTGFHLSNPAPGTKGNDVIAIVLGGKTAVADLGTHRR